MFENDVRNTIENTDLMLRQDQVLETLFPVDDAHRDQLLTSFEILENIRELTENGPNPTKHQMYGWLLDTLEMVSTFFQIQLELLTNDNYEAFENLLGTRVVSFRRMVMKKWNFFQFSFLIFYF